MAFTHHESAVEGIKLPFTVGLVLVLCVIEIIVTGVVIPRVRRPQGRRSGGCREHSEQARPINGLGVSGCGDLDPIIKPVGWDEPPAEVNPNNPIILITPMPSSKYHHSIPLSNPNRIFLLEHAF